MTYEEKCAFAEECEQLLHDPIVLAVVKGFVKPLSLRWPEFREWHRQTAGDLTLLLGEVIQLVVAHERGIDIEELKLTEQEYDQMMREHRSRDLQESLQRRGYSYD